MKKGIAFFIMVLVATLGSQTVVQFNDANLEQAIRDALNKPTGDITNVDMETITQLDILTYPQIL